MPILDTKYNIASYSSTGIKRIKPILHRDLSNLSLFHNINAFDSSCNENTNINNIPYLESRASYLINQVSKVKNCVTKFNITEESKKRFKYVKPIGCKTCDSSSNTSLSDIQTQKKIQNQVSVSSSLYSMNLKVLHLSHDINNSNNKKAHDNRSDRSKIHGSIYQKNSSIKENQGIDIKHNSYNRYLGKLKGKYLRNESENINLTPKFGNKTKKYALINCNNNC